MHLLRKAAKYASLYGDLRGYTDDSQMFEIAPSVQTNAVSTNLPIGVLCLCAPKDRSTFVSLWTVNSHRCEYFLAVATLYSIGGHGVPLIFQTKPTTIYNGKIQIIGFRPKICISSQLCTFEPYLFQITGSGNVHYQNEVLKFTRDYLMCQLAPFLRFRRTRTLVLLFNFVDQSIAIDLKLNTFSQNQYFTKRSDFKRFCILKQNINIPQIHLQFKFKTFNAAREMPTAASVAIQTLKSLYHDFRVFSCIALIFVQGDSRDEQVNLALVQLIGCGQGSHYTSRLLACYVINSIGCGAADIAFLGQTISSRNFSHYRIQKYDI
ncbi:Hypothetical_protein [Hexamita inflata]|uniref:Hypothetical_protein n=1 Tax=Hexamita inflata TaxID=28002 RepID=A0AA86TEN6_9EUKA|nr:Hypothetical protein HINF_LOCUS3255 [Hexamita inflata]